jgi:chromosomal replication initiation ATPase DnaA
MSALEFTEAELNERAAKVLGRPRLPTPAPLGDSPFAKHLTQLGATTAARAICSARGVVIDALYGRDHRPTVTMARHELQAWLRRHTKLAFAEIGGIFGRDHTTIVSASRKIGRLAVHDHGIALRQAILRDPTSV